MSDNGGGRMLPLGSTVLLVVALGGLLFFRPALKSLRPEVKAGPESRGFEKENVLARLWQDPLGVVEAALAAERVRLQAAAGRDTLTRVELPYEYRLRNLMPDGRKESRLQTAFTVVPAFLAGGYQVRQIEARRRQRQAIVMGLTQMDYRPRQADRIGFFGTAWEARPSPDSGIRVGYLASRENHLNLDLDLAGETHVNQVFFPVPYEWFEDRQGRLLLVIWLDDQKFQRQFGPMLAQLCTRIREVLHPGTVAFKVIGPTSTGGFIKLLQSTVPDGSEVGGRDDSAWQRFQLLAANYLDEAPPFGQDEELAALVAGFAQPDQLATFRAARRLARYLRATYARAVDDLDDRWPENLVFFGYHLLGASGDETTIEPQTRIAASAFDLLSTAEILAGRSLDEADAERIFRRLVAAAGRSGKGDDDRGRSAKVIADEFDLGRNTGRILATATDQYSLITLADLQATELAATELLDLEELTFYSSRATAPLPLILAAAGTDTSHPLLDNIVRCIPDDGALLELVADELIRRNLDLARGDHVALFVEWDTHYSRFLATKAREHLEANLDAGGKAWISLHPYLSGIDGSVPVGEHLLDPQRVEADNDEGRRQQGLAMNWDEETAHLALPLGRNRVDYFRRQADALRREVDSWVGEKMAAIGVLGVDVFDKLTIIQALRERFPDAVIFTTDLHAIYLHPSLTRSCQNLLIASGYGLQPCDLDPEHADSAQRAPIFRDSYQTSTYLATILALHDPLHCRAIPDFSPGSWRNIGLVAGAHAVVRDTLISAADIASYLQPKLFEIGRGAAYDITPLALASPLQPLPPLAFPRPGRFVTMLLALIAFGLLLKPVAEQYFDTSGSGLFVRDHRVRLRFTLFLLYVIFCAAVWIVMMRQNLDNTGEIFGLLTGVSVWPSIYLRLTALFLAGFYIIWYVREVEVDQRQLVADYGLVDPRMFGPDCPEELRFHQLPWYRRCYPQAEWFESDQAGAAAGSSRALAVWCSYFRFGRVGARLGRAAMAAVLMFVLGILVAVFMSYPDPPVRGATALLVERLGVTLAGLVFLWLYFLALDSMLLTTIMLRWLVGRRVHFEPEVRATVTERFGLAARDVDLVDRYLSLRIIGRPTHLYGEVIFWPVVVLVLMMLARWSRFDAWGYPQVDQVLQAVLAVMVIASAVTLRRRGDHVKREVLDLVRQRLDAASSEVIGSDSAEDRRRVHALQRLLAHIETMQEGVFKPWRRHPIVKTALLVGVVLLTVLNQVLHVI